MASFQHRPTVVTIEDAINRLAQATDHATDVPRYWNDLAENEDGRAASTENPQRKAKALYRAYEYDLKADEANPLEVNSIYTLDFPPGSLGAKDTLSFNRKPYSSMNF